MVDWRSTSWATSNFQASLEIGVIHTGSGLVAAHHMANWVIESPSENIFELQQTALEGNDEMVSGFLKGAVGDEVASDTSYHCTDLQRLAWLRPHYRLSHAVSRSEKLRATVNEVRSHPDIARK